MSQPTDDAYFEWLYKHVGSVRVRNRAKMYWKLCRQLFGKEFVWVVPNDDNRAADGKALRQEFLDSHGDVSVDDGWLNLECSMFEMLIALSRRLSFETDYEPQLWFWRMMHHIELDTSSDAQPIPEHLIDHVLDRVIWRTYKPSGVGGLFPLLRPNEDQRNVELWYQFCAYLLERHEY